MAILFFFLITFTIFFSSKHPLVVLIIIELLSLFSLLHIIMNSCSLLSVVFFLTVVVCVGAYGISLLVSASPMKGGSHFLFF